MKHGFSRGVMGLVFLGAALLCFERFGDVGATPYPGASVFMDVKVRGPNQVAYREGIFPGISLKGLLEYGDVAVGQRKTKKMSVVNPGFGPLHVKAVHPGTTPR